MPGWLAGSLDERMERMDGWMDELMSGWMHGLMDERWVAIRT